MLNLLILSCYCTNLSSINEYILVNITKNNRKECRISYFGGEYTPSFYSNFYQITGILHFMGDITVFSREKYTMGDFK